MSHPSSAFARLTRHFVEVDGIVSVEEQKVLASRSEETRRHGLIGPPVHEEEVPDLLAAFRTPQARACALLELICVGHVDGHFCAAESQFVRRVAATFGVTRERIEQMEKWTAEQIERSREAARFWAT